MLTRIVRNPTFAGIGHNVNIRYNEPYRRFNFDSLAEDLIPNIKDKDNSWLLDAEKGRPALAAVLEDPFFFWERQQRLAALGQTTTS